MMFNGSIKTIYVYLARIATTSKENLRIPLVFIMGMGFSVFGYAAQTCNSSIVKSTPTSQFTIMSNDIVLDNKTGLMWDRCPLGEFTFSNPPLLLFCSASALLTYNWKDALEQAANHSQGGYDDWRIPNIKELASITEVSCINPAMNIGVFPPTNSNEFWTSSPEIRIEPYTTTWTFKSGAGSLSTRQRSGTLFSVRVVRGGN